MAKELINKPGWLETLWNVNPRLAKEAENDIISWIEEGISEEISIGSTDLRKWSTGESHSIMENPPEFLSRFKRKDK